jgi:hypothetical protein
MPVINRIADLQPEMEVWRRDLHEYPELRFEEQRTASQVAKLLASWGIEVHTNIAKTGVVGVLRGAKPGRTRPGPRRRRKFAPRVVGSGRGLEQIFNLVDMNIIPINVHAMMRDIPLANLYNYEYTFEQMIVSMFGESLEGVTDANIANMRRQLRRLGLAHDPRRSVATTSSSEMADV